MGKATPRPTMLKEGDGPYYGYGSYAAYSDAVNAQAGFSSPTDTTRDPDAPGGIGASAITGEVDVSQPTRIARRRAELGPLQTLPPDLADTTLRDIGTGRLRRARGGSTARAFGRFDVRAPLSAASSPLGGW